MDSRFFFQKLFVFSSFFSVINSEFIAIGQIHNEERTVQHISSVTSQEWFDHFNKVLDYETLSVSDNEVENNALASTFEPVESVDTLDGVISVSEVLAAINALKDNKAAGPDGLSSDFFR